MDTTKAIDILAQKVTVPPSQYVGDDGMLHCGVCHEPIESIVTILGHQRTMPCICKCREEELEARAKEEAAKLVEERRSRCFSGAFAKLKSCSFNNDSFYHPDIRELGIRYAERFKETLEEGERQGRGLLLLGQVGTGKTWLACAIANMVIDEGYTALFTSFNRIYNRLMESFEGKEEVMEELVKPDLLILDDLGVERGTEYMQEVVFSVLDKRINSLKPMIITTNLTKKELEETRVLSSQRIYDRVLSVCLPVPVKGLSIRKKEADRWHERELKELQGD